MPGNKHKRKAVSKIKHKQKSTTVVKSSGLVTSHPVAFIFVGLSLIVLGLFFIITDIQDSAMFGLALIMIIAGVATAIYANFALPKKKNTTIE